MRWDRYWIPATHVQDDGRGRRGGQPGHCVSDPGQRRLLRALQPQGKLQTHGLSAAVTTARAQAVDISYVNVCGTFYYLTSILDGASRYIVHWELRESMREADVKVVLQRARETFPDARPRIITDNGPQFIARDFHEFIRLSGMTHVRTSPYYPQSNGKIERWHGTLKRDCLRPHVPLSLEDARKLVARFVAHYNHTRLHSAIGYVTPGDKLAGREASIFAQRDRKLAEARERRAERWLLAKHMVPNRKPERRKKPEEIRDLVVKIARETGWGYTRILGELRKLNINAISRQPVVNILKEHDHNPYSRKGSGRWDELFKRHADTLWQCDFFSKRVFSRLGFPQLFAIVFLNVARRVTCILSAGSTSKEC